VGNIKWQPPGGFPRIKTTVLAQRQTKETASTVIAFLESENIDL
jgi:hypothetical protein